MPRLSNSDVITYVENNIGNFHEKRVEKIKKLKLEEVLKRKNPYLFKAKNILTAHELVKNVLDAYLSSQEETLFGEFLEGLAIYICGKIYGGEKAHGIGLDLKFEKDKKLYLVSVKSGPNWGNSSQIEAMKKSFARAKQIVRRPDAIMVNGCCYGRENSSNKGDYLKLCGQEFWTLISGDEKLYTKIIEPLGHKAKEKNEKFYESYAAILNKFELDFIKVFCDKTGNIDWNRLVKFNSAKTVELK